MAAIAGAHWMAAAAVIVACIFVQIESVSAAEPGTVYEQRRMPSRILGKDVHFTVYLPPDYERGNRSYPVVYLLHGGWDGENEDWFRFGGANRMLDQMIEQGDIPPVIAVTPDARRDETSPFDTYYMNDADGGYRWEDMFLEEFVPYIDKAYRTIPQRSARGAVGLSMGGYAAVAYGMKYPDLFAGAAILSGAFRTDEQIVALDQPGYDKRYGKAWGENLEGKSRLNAAYRANSVFELAKTLVPGAYGQTRFYFDCGADDVFFAGNAALHLQLQDLKIQHRFMVREGKHEWDYWRSGLREALLFVGDVFFK